MKNIFKYAFTDKWFRVCGYISTRSKTWLRAQTDIYFFALVFITYLETFVNITWFA